MNDWIPNDFNLMANILITGVAGFIGAALAEVLLKGGDTVYGIDNLNDYYDVNLKRARLARLTRLATFQFLAQDIANRELIPQLIAQRFNIIVNLAAQPGVRYSIEHPHPYADTNIVGFLNMLEVARHSEVQHFVFASSSSVYGANPKQPFSEQDNVDHPISLYAASKKANELIAHSYAHLYQLPCTGLRFFTVYGPWMRPDMALFKFAQGIMKGLPIPVYNHGNMVRDFTYIDDIVEGVVRIINHPAQSNPKWQETDPATSHAPYRIYNIGTHEKVQLMHYLHVLERHLGKTAQLELLPMQPGDVPTTQADTSALFEAVGYTPQTTVEQGVARFAEWFKIFYGYAS
jgi:UDP-glucuronate 4-epimerase